MPLFFLNAKLFPPLSTFPQSPPTFQTIHLPPEVHPIPNAADSFYKAHLTMPFACLNPRSCKIKRKCLSLAPMPAESLPNSLFQTNLWSKPFSLPKTRTGPSTPLPACFPDVFCTSWTVSPDELSTSFRIHYRWIRLGLSFTSLPAHLPCSVRGHV